MGRVQTATASIGRRSRPLVPGLCELRAGLLELLLDLLLGPLAGDGELLDDELLRVVEHLALAEREHLAALEPIQVAIDLGDVEQRAGLDLLHEAAIAAVPRLLVDVDILLAQDVEDFFD